MTDTTTQRWIDATITEIAKGVPVLPWERAAKRQRCLAAGEDREKFEKIAVTAE